MDNLHTGQLSHHFFLTSDQPEAENLGPKLHPGGGFFDKLPETTDFGLFLQSQNRARF